MKAKNHIMRYRRFTAAPIRLMPFSVMLVATALGGCVGAAEYPSQGYSYNYPSGYYAGYPRAYNVAWLPPLLFSDHRRVQRYRRRKVAVATEVCRTSWIQSRATCRRILEEIMTTILIIVVLLICPSGRWILRLSPTVVTI